MFWALIGIAILSVVGIILLIRRIRNTSQYDKDTYRNYGFFKKSIKSRKTYKMIESNIIVVFSLLQEVTMKVPISSIERIDGNVLIFKPNSPDYLLIRQGIEEIAPAVSTNIISAIITFH